jgi:sporulation protein YlmC with PRC-barrel domain
MTIGDATLYTLGDFGQTVAGSADDVRGRAVKDRNGDDIGTVADLLIDDQAHRVRFLLVEHGGFLGFGRTKTLIPVDAITKISEDEVLLDQSRERIAAAPGYDPALVDDRPYHSSIFGYYGYAPFWGVGYGYPMGLGALPMLPGLGGRVTSSGTHQPGSSAGGNAESADPTAHRVPTAGPDGHDQPSGRRTPWTRPTGGGSNAEFGHRMESVDNEIEYFSDSEDVDVEDRNDAESAATTPAVPNMVAAFAQPVKDAPAH